MNRQSVIAFAFALSAAIPAFAEVATVVDVTPTRSQLTRAEVRAEVLRASAAGELYGNEAAFPFDIRPARSPVVRAEVLAQAKPARPAIELDATRSALADQRR